MKEKKTTPSGDEVCAAICTILDKAVNAESPNAPKQMRLILTEQNPNWKLPERRVAKYMKRILKSRKDPRADGIDANEDEVSAAGSTSSKGSFFKRLRSNRKSRQRREGGEESAPQDNLLLPSLEDTEERVESNEPGSNAQPKAEDAYKNQTEGDENEKEKKRSYFCEGSTCMVM